MEQRDFDLALLDASQAGDASRIQSLIGQGAQAKSEIGDCALFIATDSGYAEVAKVLLAHGARPNARDPKNSMPLHHAALLGHNDLVRLLLDNGARIDGKNRDNETALHAATIAGHTDTVDLLLSRSAKTDAKDDSGLTPLMYAAFYGSTAIVELLLTYHADVHKGRRRALRLAEDQGHEEIVAILKAAGETL